MIKKFFALNVFLFLPVFTTNAQDSFIAETSEKKTVKLSYLDSLKSTFVIDEMTTCVDSMWMKEISDKQGFDEMYADVTKSNTDVTVDFELPTELFKERLRLLDEKSPFNIEYNVGLENLVKTFLKSRKRSFERLMGVSQYYFPMFEEALAKYNVPLEIKYLAIVESALNPKAVSRVGATGLWQFMYQTGKQYGLKVDSYVDERSDALKASEAAAKYMTNMYKIFGDWELVLASYNSGAGNVSKAIRRSGGMQNFWNIKKHLPRETQGYVPAFLATMYIFEYHKEHGIVPNKPVALHFETDTIAVKKKISFKQLSDLLDISMAELEFLNPSYKMKVVPYVTNQANFICLPKSKVAVFTSNEDKMYAYVDYIEGKREKQFMPKPKSKIVKDSIDERETGEDALAENSTTTKTVLRTKYHTVKKGDNIGEIANKYNVAQSDLKKWNKLKSNNIQLGKRLRIMTSENVVVSKRVNKTSVAIKVEKAIVSTEKGVKEEVINQENSTEHIVKQGETLLGIAKQHKLYVADLKKWNNLKDSTIKAGDVIKLNTPTTVQSTELVDNETISYVVKSGDNLSLIADKNNVSVAELKLWNNLSSAVLKVGDKLKIQKSGDISTDFSKKKKEFQEQKMYIVQKGDSLFIISQKHKTTVAEIKKLNDLTDENIKPGMKLKI